MKKILHVISNLKTERYIGVQSLYHHLSNMENEISIITWSINSYEIKKINLNPHLKIYEVPGFLVLPKYISAENPILFNYLKIIKNKDFDIFHIHGLLMLSTPFIIFFAYIFKKPIILTIHGVLAERSPIINTLQKIYIMCIGKILFKKSNIIITLTKADRNELIRYGCKKEKIKIIPNGVDINSFYYKNNHYQINNKRLLFIGRIVPEKGLRYLLSALLLVKKIHPDIKLVIVGDGFDKKLMMQFVINNNLQHNVIFLGEIRKSEIKTQIDESLMIIIPSLREGMPYTLLESMSCGKAVIASNIPGINDVIENNVNGILIPPKNSKILAKKVIELLGNYKLRIELGKNARNYIVKYHDNEKIARKIDELYRELMIN